MKKKFNKREKIYQITAILLMIDQFIKILVNHYMDLNQNIIIIPNFFNIHYVKNTGAAFSILQNSSIILTIISVIIIILLDRFIKKESKTFSKLEVISFGMIMGGIFGNLIDRIIHHAVIDYLSFIFFTYSYPVFNFADMCIVLGVIVMIIEITRKGRNN